MRDEFEMYRWLARSIDVLSDKVCDWRRSDHYTPPSEQAVEEMELALQTLRLALSTLRREVTKT